MKDLMRTAQELPLLSDSDIALNLTSQRIKAKELRDAVRSGDPGACERVQIRHPRPHAVDFGSFKLTDAQCVIAREAGLSSWPALKAHVESMEAARVAIEANTPAPDSDLRTLHIRCGNDIELGLKRAGFAGDFLMYSDPICQGPVSDLPDAIQVRAQFISSEYPGEDLADTISKLQGMDEILAKAKEYERIALWFEHDPYDQLLLVKVLAQLKAAGADSRKVELMSLHCFPGITKFIGIGQLSPAALRHMYAKREAVSAGAYQLAGKAWEALTAPSPLPLYELAARKTPFLPYLPDAIERYLAELPGLDDGLSFTERSILQILQNGPRPWGRIFRKFMQDTDPLPFHGDLMFYADLLRLTRAEVPPLRALPQNGDEEWGQHMFELTGAGRLLLDGDRDFKAYGPAERWNGGVRCFGDPDWRWDRIRRAPAASPSPAPVAH
ncbi:DUF1835 domain-containing protein [Roseibium litorale]|uniref:DUF1835 domain-containing protein n=1 Tax=Roseibium litorale TaxID=2803841 RepID=A0ABR9CMH1_9HYPH|nr:DUF1835 domain-containing protein [Roseibium litorale]MBD8891794.1 DUF1835 domain-containing protein [Roseibium litorale]